MKGEGMGAIPDYETAIQIINEQDERIAKAEARNKVLEEALIRLRDCDWVITPRDRMDAVREIARAALREDR